MKSLDQLYDAIIERKNGAEQGSYTNYLFEQGTDKILKKCGEELTEIVIAAKNGDNSHTVEEISDLLYHLTVLMIDQGIKPNDVWSELEKRSAKQKNLKQSHTVDKNT